MTELVVDYTELKNLVESHGEAKNCSLGIKKCEKCQRIKELRKRVYPDVSVPTKNKFIITDANGEEFVYYSYKSAIKGFFTYSDNFRDFLISGECDKCFIKLEEINKVISYTKINKTLYKEKEVITVEKDGFQKDFLSMAEAGRFIGITGKLVRNKLKKGDFLHDGYRVYRRTTLYPYRTFTEIAN